MTNGLSRIQQGISSLKPSEQKAANYILSHPEEVLNMSIASLSEASKVSEATIIRMCRALNFTGYQALKLSLSASLNEPVSKDRKYQDISENGNIADIMKAVSFNNLRSIEDTLNVLDVKEIEKAITAIDHARKVDMYGVGASAIIALDFEQKCKRINRWCQAFSDNHTQLTSAVHLTSQDVVLAVSYSGETKEILESVRVAKNNGATIISLTGFTKNSLQRMADIRLYTSSQEKSIRSGAMASRIAQLNVIDILFTGIASKNYEETAYYLDRTGDVVKNRK